MARLGWVYVHRWRAGARKRGGNLLSNMARLAHAYHYHTAFAGQYDLAGLDEVSIDALEQLRDGSALYLYGSKSAGNEGGIGVHSDQIIP